MPDHTATIEELEAQFKSAVAETIDAEKALLAIPTEHPDERVRAQGRVVQANQARDRIQQALHAAHQQQNAS